MKLIGIQAVMVFLTAFFSVIQAQDMKGIVLGENNLPIANVSIIIEDKTIVKTDKAGVFFIPQGYTIPLEIILEHPNYDSMTVVLSENHQQFTLKESFQTENLNTILLHVEQERGNKVLIPTAIIDSDAIRQQSPVDLVAAINQTPGIYIQSGAINTNRIVIRGVGSRTLYGSNKVRGYFNEIPITNGVGETAIDIYDPEDLQSIEIIKGPKATQYGTNLGGTILLTSKQPETEGISIRNSTTAGSFGLFKNSLTADYSTKKFDFHLTYAHLEQEGFRANSQYNRNATLLNSTYRFNGNTELSLLINYVDYTAQIPSSISRSAFDEDPSQAAFSWQQAKGIEADAQTLAGITLKHAFTSTFKNTTSIFYSYSDHYEPRPFNILDEYTNGFGIRSVFSKSFKVMNRSAEWTFGTELLKDDYHWKTIENLYEETNGNGSLEGILLSNNEEYRQQLNVFSSVKLPLTEHLNLQFGINYNKTRYEFQDEFHVESNTSVNRDFDVIVAPNLNLRYDFNANQQVFANVSYGFNYPSLEETLTSEGVINPEIAPEQGFNYELGSESFFFNRTWHVLASVYILDIKDLLVAQRVGDDQYIGRNAGQTLHKGLELSTDYRWVVNTSFIISPYINASFNWHRFEAFVSDNTDYSGNELTGVPDMTIASGIAFTYKNVSLFSNHLYIGEMPMNDSNSLYSESYILLNLKLTYNFRMMNKFNVGMNVGVNNVLDTPYASSILINATGFNNSEPRYYYPGNPRNFYGGISVVYRL